MPSRHAPLNPLRCRCYTVALHTVASNVVDPGSARIRIDLALLDPDLDPYLEYPSGSGSRTEEDEHNKQQNLISSLFPKGLCTYVQ